MLAQLFKNVVLMCDGSNESDIKRGDVPRYLRCFDIGITKLPQPESPHLKGTSMK